MLRLCFMLFILCPSLAFSSLDELAKRIEWDLKHLPYPNSWTEEQGDALEVAIIGAGMAGLGAAYGLIRLGIHNIVLFDESPEGEEGPWVTYAHMKVLLTEKFATGPCLFTPSLTFQAWFEAKYGLAEWDRLEKATPEQWMEYLCWFKKRLDLPVVNNCHLKLITPVSPHLFRLEFERNNAICTAHAKKVILATGRLGFGGKEIPPYMEGIPPTFFAHSADPIDFTKLAGKKIGIVGCGSSAFDAAGMALESDAASVDLLFRRLEVPSIHPFDPFAHVGMEQGFHLLSDEWRFRLMAFAHQFGVPPSDESIARTRPFSNFHLKNHTTIEGISVKGQQLEVVSNQGNHAYDFLILATGFHIGKDQIPELKGISQHILLWKDKVPAASSSKIGEFPYLGPHFQFIEAQPGKAPYLRHIYCFNYGALLSHGLTSSSIDAISAGAERVAKGIAADFFAEEIESYFQNLQEILN